VTMEITYTFKPTVSIMTNATVQKFPQKADVDPQFLDQNTEEYRVASVDLSSSCLVGINDLLFRLSIRDWMHVGAE